MQSIFPALIWRQVGEEVSMMRNGVTEHGGRNRKTKS